jgi:hypothetical protein
VAHKLLAKEEIFEMVRVARAGAIVIMFIMFEDALCHFFAAFRSVCALLLHGARRFDSDLDQAACAAGET